MAPLVSSVRDDGSINTANTISAYRGFLQLTLPMIAKARAISLTYRTSSRLINLISLYKLTRLSSHHRARKRPKRPIANYFGAS